MLNTMVNAALLMSPLSAGALGAGNAKKRGFDEGDLEDFDRFDDEQQRVAGARDENSRPCDGPAAEDHEMEHELEQQQQHEEERGHAPLASPRPTAPRWRASPSSSSSPHRPAAKAVLLARARSLFGASDGPHRPPLIERRANFDGVPIPAPPSSPVSHCRSSQTQVGTPPGTPCTPRAGSEADTPGTPCTPRAGSEADTPDSPPTLLLASSNANGSKLSLHPKLIYGAKERATFELLITPRNPLVHVLAHGVHVADKVLFTHTWVKGKDVIGVGREFCSLQTYRREVRGLLFGGRYTEYDLVNCQPS
ncbi:hypothetical protein T492DRAFT_1134598 [Pavlovales sp. CCMP2436]|nr:hypothetical protein T492DRAFT_1134598 [Pavlovales sp. CCMP2436]